MRQTVIHIHLSRVLAFHLKKCKDTPPCVVGAQLYGVDKPHCYSDAGE